MLPLTRCSRSTGRDRADLKPTEFFAARFSPADGRRRMVKLMRSQGGLFLRLAKVFSGSEGGERVSEPLEAPRFRRRSADCLTREKRESTLRFLQAHGVGSLLLLIKMLYSGKPNSIRRARPLFEKGAKCEIDEPSSFGKCVRNFTRDIILKISCIYTEIRVH